MKKRFLLALLLPILVLGVLAGALAWYVDQALAVRGGRVEVTLPHGTSMRQAARLLADGGVEVSPTALYWMARLGGHAHRIKAGSYEVAAGISPRELIDKLVRGEVVLREIAFIEGWTFRQVRAALDRHPDLAHDSRDLGDDELLERVGASHDHPEGLFFPDTYRFDKGTSDLAVLRRAYEQMQVRLAEAWEARAPGLPLETPYEALTLASIIEKESGNGDDRALIASVFVNRLRSGMLLQTDPTVIYGMGERFDGNLRRRDLDRDGDYNTYTRTGLPPTPIAMPGQAALAAALNPPDSDYYYFVARGDGSSQFSRTLAEHNRAVREFQLKRRAGG